MKFAFASPSRLNSLLLAGLLATVGTGSLAQGATAAPSAATRPAGPSGERMADHDPAKMQAMMARHHAEMKVKLKITPAQEGAWSSYTAAMQPPAGMMDRPTPEQRAALDNLATPQRIDKMREMRTERMTAMNAAMDKRAEATKALYAALSPEQQKVFDTESKKHRDHRDHEGMRHHDGMHGASPQKG